MLSNREGKEDSHFDSDPTAMKNAPPLSSNENRQRK
jgi:hypothetical protein